MVQTVGYDSSRVEVFVWLNFVVNFEAGMAIMNGTASYTLSLHRSASNRILGYCRLIPYIHTYHICISRCKRCSNYLRSTCIYGILTKNTKI